MRCLATHRGFNSGRGLQTGLESTRWCLPLRNYDCIPPSLSSFLPRRKALPSFGAHPLSSLLVPPATLLCPMPPLQGLRHIVSAFRALPTSLPRSRRSVLVFALFVLCTLKMFVVVLKHGQRLANSIRYI
jgi:hypothetical protein